MSPPPPPPGAPAYVTLGRRPIHLGPGLEPQRIRHASLDLVWTVSEVLKSWEYPDALAITERRVLVQRFTVRVFDARQPGDLRALRHGDLALQLPARLAD